MEFARISRSVDTHSLAHTHTTLTHHTHTTLTHHSQCHTLLEENEEHIERWWFKLSVNPFHSTSGALKGLNSLSTGDTRNRT